jgi:hypothetical protein
VGKLEAELSAATELVEAVQEALQSGLSLVTQDVTTIDLIEWLEAFQRWLDAAREELYTGEAVTSSEATVSLLMRPAKGERLKVLPLPLGGEVPQNRRIA